MNRKDALEPRSPSTHQKVKDQQKILPLQSKTYQVLQSVLLLYLSLSIQAVYKSQARIVGSTAKSSHTYHEALLRESLRSFQW